MPGGYDLIFNDELVIKDDIYWANKSIMDLTTGFPEYNICKSMSIFQPLDGEQKLINRSEPVNEEIDPLAILHGGPTNDVCEDYSLHLSNKTSMHTKFMNNHDSVDVKYLISLDKFKQVKNGIVESKYIKYRGPFLQGTTERYYTVDAKTEELLIADLHHSDEVEEDEEHIQGVLLSEAHQEDYEFDESNLPKIQPRQDSIRIDDLLKEHKQSS